MHGGIVLVQVPIGDVATVLRVSEELATKWIGWYDKQALSGGFVCIDTINAMLGQYWAGESSQLPNYDDLAEQPGESLLTLSEASQLSPEYVMQIISGELPVFRICYSRCSKSGYVLIPKSVTETHRFDAGAKAITNVHLASKMLGLPRTLKPIELAKRLGVQLDEILPCLSFAGIDALYAKLEGKLLGRGVTPEGWHRMTSQDSAISLPIARQLAGSGVIANAVAQNHLPSVLNVKPSIFSIKIERAIWRPAVLALLKPDVIG